MNSVLNQTGGRKAAINPEKGTARAGAAKDHFIEGASAKSRTQAREKRRRVERDEQEARRHEERASLTSLA